MTATTPAPPFTAQIEQRDRLINATLAGEATFERADDLRDLLLAAADRPITGFIVDVSELTFISSVGLGALVAVYLHCRGRNVDFHVTGARGKVLAMFEVTKLTRLFRVHPTTTAAN